MAIAGAGEQPRGSSPTAMGGSWPRGCRRGARRRPAPTRAMIAAARPLLAHRDAAVRSVAADIVGRAASARDLPALTQAYKRTGGDSFPEAALSALGAIAAIGKSGPQAQTQVDREFLAGTPRPTDYLHSALGRGELARGGRPLGTRPPDHHRADAAGLSRGDAPLRHRARFAEPSPREDRDRAARPDRDRAARARRAAHRRELPAAGGPAVLRQQPLASGGAQLRRAGRGSRGATDSAARAARSATRSTATATTRRCWAWPFPAPTPATASGSSTSVPSPISTAPTRCSARW